MKEWHGDPAVVAFVAAGLGFPRGFGPAVGMGWGDLLIEAGVVFHNWQPEQGVVEISAYSLHRRWLNKDRLRSIFSHAFDAFGCRMVVVRMSERNTRSRRIWKALGGQEHVIPRLLSDDEAECIVTLHRADWMASKYMRDADGQIRTEAA